MLALPIHSGMTAEGEGRSKFSVPRFGKVAMNITSNPEGATVALNGRMMGVTPLEIHVEEYALKPREIGVVEISQRPDNDDNRKRGVFRQDL
jgi:hypothetical protein